MRDPRTSHVGPRTFVAALQDHSLNPFTTPMRDIACCCARTVSGYATVAPPRTSRKYGRFMSALKLSGRYRIGLSEYFYRGRNRHQNLCRSAHPMSVVGHKRTNRRGRKSIFVRCYSNSGQTRVRVDCPLSANRDRQRVLGSTIEGCIPPTPTAMFKGVDSQSAPSVRHDPLRSGRLVPASGLPSIGRRGPRGRNALRALASL
jgi:hypothetical protein